MANGDGLYSRFVAIMKVGLPLLALVLLAGLFLIPPAEERERGLAFSEADLAALGEGLLVAEPVLTGMTRADEPFRFTAASVVPDAAPPSRAAISRLAGRIDLAGGPGVDVEAPDADLDLAAQVMALSGRVTVRTTDGYRIVADVVEIDLIAGSVHASGAVDGEGPMGTIAAETMAIVPAETDADRRVISFGNGVRLVYGGLP
ncbi:hypothetical protein BH23PSE1_BH23PSE1_07170 [soil metagenome]